MCASERRFAIALVAAVLAALPAAAQTGRAEEQVRRLRQQLQQLQQEAAAQQQAAQKAESERAALQRGLDAAEAQLKAQGGRLAAQSRAADAASRQLGAAAQQKAELDERAAALQAALDAERRGAAALRADLQKSERQRQTQQDSYAGLAARHRTQAEGLATCIDRNAQLRALGGELLQRYESKGIAAVLAADEPFLQWGRVSLENLVQDYRDKLDAQAVAGPR